MQRYKNILNYARNCKKKIQKKSKNVQNSEEMTIFMQIRSKTDKIFAYMEKI
jgi:hypothetical protein